MDFSPSVMEFASALVGALIGGGVSLYTTHKSHRMETQKELKREEKEVHNLLLAMQTEMSTLWQFHMRKVGYLIEELKEGDVLQFYYPLTLDYFTVYHESADQLGKVRNDKLRNIIVVCYNKAKKVVDAFIYHNRLLEAYAALNDTDNPSPKHQARIEAKRKELQTFAMFLKENHFELKGYVEELITLISKNH
jgi:hypothetical protein